MCVMKCISAQHFSIITVLHVWKVVENILNKASNSAQLSSIQVSLFSTVQFSSRQSNCLLIYGFLTILAVIISHPLGKCNHTITQAFDYVRLGFHKPPLSLSLINLVAQLKASSIILHLHPPCFISFSCLLWCVYLGGIWGKIHSSETPLCPKSTQPL